MPDIPKGLLPLAIKHSFIAWDSKGGVPLWWGLGQSPSLLKKRFRAEKMKKLLLISIILCLIIVICSCGKKGPPVPPVPLAPGDDPSDLNDKGVEIVDDKAERIYKLYGEAESKVDMTPPPKIKIDELEEVPDDYRYLYENDDDQSEDDKSKDDSSSEK